MIHGSSTVKTRADLPMPVPWIMAVRPGVAAAAGGETREDAHDDQ